MLPHDAYARRTPYEMAFPDDGRAEALISTLLEEAEARGVDVGDLSAFEMLSQAGAFVHELQGPEAPPEAIHDYLALLYHAFHFARAGRPVHLVDTAAARHLVGGAPAGAAPEAPQPAGYVQLPRHLFWVDKEPVDGFFWTLDTEDRMHLLLATGMRDDRPGVAVVSVPGAPFGEAQRWLVAEVRGDGTDFATTLPGGEIEGLYSLTAAGEALKLVARIFAYEHVAPDAVRAYPPHEVPAGSAEGATHSAPVPSRLPYVRIGLDG